MGYYSWFGYTFSYRMTPTRFFMSVYCFTLKADNKKKNHVILMKMSQLNKTDKQDDSKVKIDHMTVMLFYFLSGDSEDELDDDEPILDTVMIQHGGAVNRIRVKLLKHLNVYNYISTIYNR